jgi:hypothetical protein
MNITVASIEWPKPGKKIGAVIDSTGKRWGVWPDKLPIFQQFATYEITYESNDFKGQTYYTIKTATLIGGNGMQQPSTQRQSLHPATAPAAYVRQERDTNLSQTDNQRRMDIFCCGAFNNIMANPGVHPFEMPVDQMIRLIDNLKVAWKRTLGPQAQETVERGARNADLNDEIGF